MADRTGPRSPGSFGANPRPRGLSVRARLALSYAGFLLLAVLALIGVVWVFLLRYVPDRAVVVPADGVEGNRPGGLFVPGRSDLWAAFAPKAALVLVGCLVLGLVGGWFLAGRMLAPLTRIAEATRTTATGSLSHRIAMPGRADEFRELADSFDTMLERMEAQVAEQQRFAANASHELRTPLAITQTLLEVARNDPRRADDPLDDRLREVNARAIAVTEAMLVLSRADQRAFAREPVDLSLVAEEAAETLLPLAEKHGVTVVTSGPVAFASGSPTLLLQMTMNLLHNAILHNLPADGAVWIGTARWPQYVALTVENTGDSVDPLLIPTLTERFQRGTARIRKDQSGVGLGLAIVRSIVQAHDGELTLAPRPGGGLTVTIRLPAAAG